MSRKLSQQQSGIKIGIFKSFLYAHLIAFRKSLYNSTIYLAMIVQNTEN